MSPLMTKGKAVETTSGNDNQTALENKIPDEAVNVLEKATSALKRLVKRQK